MHERVEIQMRRDAAHWRQQQNAFGGVVQLALMVSAFALFLFLCSPSITGAVFFGGSLVFLVAAVTVLIVSASRVAQCESVIIAARPTMSGVWTRENCVEVEVIHEDTRYRQTYRPRPGGDHFDLRYLPSRSNRR